VERVTFLVERTGDRISCLLNPEMLEARRVAGVVRRQGAGGAVLGTLRGDDPLIATGGGITEYDLRLLFDVDIANEGRASAARAGGTAVGGPSEGGNAIEDSSSAAGDAPAAVPVAPPASDVRALTRPLWALAETGAEAGSGVAPQRMRFIWGTAWNVPAIVIAASERLDRFDANGVPQRSWLSLRLRRVDEESDAGLPPPDPVTPQFESGSAAAEGSSDADYEAVPLMIDELGIPLERIDQIAAARYGDPTLARALAAFNGIFDMLDIPEGTVLRLPPRALLDAIA